MSHSLRPAAVRTPLSRAVASILVLSLVAPQQGVASDAVSFEDLVAWGMQSHSAEDFAESALNAGLDRGLHAARASELPFLGSLQGGITYDHALRRFDYDLLTMLRLLGDGEGHAWLAQIGVHNLRDRRTLNAGLVYRWVDSEAGYLLGGNVFFDRDYDAGANRLGAGLEAMTETMRLFTNFYTPQGGWVVSPNDPYLEERPARGHDLGVAWTPRWFPMADLQLKGAQWQGAAVDVFGNGTTEADPTVWSARIGLAPVPAILLGLEHSRVVGGEEDLRLSLTWTHRFGMSGLAQWTPGNTAMRNDLRQRALMPVEREKRIVMDTRERYAEPVFASDAVQAAVLEGESFEHVVHVTGGASPFAFALAGADAALFRLSGATLHLPAQDREAPADADSDSVYDATVLVTDARGRQAQQRIAVTVQAAVPGVRNARIEGESKVDRTLTLSFDFHSPIDEAEDAAGRSIQWFRRATHTRSAESTDITGATGTTYVPVMEDVGQELGARIVVRSVEGRSNEARPAEVSGPRVGEGSPPTASPSIEGMFEVGRLLAGTVGYADADGDTEGEHLYQWFRADDASGTSHRIAIDGATSPTYTMTGADQGRYLVFEVTPRSSTGFPSIGEAASAVASVIGTGTAPVANGVGISGTTRVREVLRAQYIYGDVDGDLKADSTYQWYRADDASGVVNRIAIVGANAATYDIVGADQGKYLVFEVTPKSLAGTPDVGEPSTAVTSTTVTGSAPVASAVFIDGDAMVGQQLTGKYTYGDADDDLEGGSTCQWFRMGANPQLPDAYGPIDGATAATHTVVAADLGKSLAFSVTPKSVTGDPATGVAVRAYTGGTVIGRAPVITNARLIGDPVVGATLTLEYDYDDADGDPEGDTQIAWCYDGGECWDGGTTLRVPEEAEGQRIVVDLLPKSAVGVPDTGRTVFTAPTAVVTRITGVVNTTARELQWLSLVNFLQPLAASGGTAPYTYEVVGEMPPGLSLNASTGVVSGAVGALWIPAAEAGGNLPAWEPTFRVKDANNVYAANTSTVRFSLMRPDVWAGSLDIAGELKLNATLESYVGVGTTLPGAVPTAHHQWYRADDANMGNLSAIPGATASSYTITLADDGKYLVLQATPTTDRGFDGIPIRAMTDRVILTFQQ